MEQLVCGIADERIQRHLLAETQLDLAKALQVSRSLEMSTKDAQVIAGQSGTSGHVAVHAAVAAAAVTVHCWRCDRANHSPEICRFRNLKCRNCGQLGHIQRECRRRQRQPATAGMQSGRRRRQRANNVTGSASENEEDWENWVDTEASIGQIRRAPDTETADVRQVGGSPPFTCTVNFQHSDVTMEIDTGSRYTLIGEDTFKSLTTRPRLRECRVKLRAYTRQPIPVLGEFRTSVKHNNMIYPNLKVIVVQRSRSSLLGRDWLERIRFNWCRGQSCPVFA